MPSKTIYIESLTLEIAEKMAKDEGRSLSNFIARLVMQEHYRQNLKPRVDVATWANDQPAMVVGRGVADVK